MRYRLDSGIAGAQWQAIRADVVSGSADVLLWQGGLDHDLDLSVYLRLWR
jgi:hypothetical protein